MATAYGGRRNPVTVTELAAAGDLNGAGTTADLTGAGGAVIVVQNDGTDGGAGQDILEFSHDGGSSWKALTAANLGNRRAGLLDSSGSAVANAALNPVAGTEVDAVYAIGPMSGPVLIRVGRGGTGHAGIAWTTGAPSVVCVRVG